MNPLWRDLLYIFPAIILFITLLPLYFVLKKKGETEQSLVVKGLCTLVPVVFCLNGCLVNGYLPFWWMLLGLLLYLAGDIAIEKKASVGVAAFMSGHLLFIVAFLLMAKPRFLCIPVLIILFTIALILFRKPLMRMRMRAVPFILYAIVLFAMLSLALNLPSSIGTAFMAGGAFLFAVSNLLLARSHIPESEIVSARSEIIRLLVYYAALYLFALSVWM